MSLLYCTALDLTTILSFWWLPDLASAGRRFSDYVFCFLGFWSEFVEVFLGWWWLSFGWIIGTINLIISLLYCIALDLTTILSFWWLPDLASAGLRFSDYVLCFLGFRSEFVEVFLGWWWLSFGWFHPSHTVPHPLTDPNRHHRHYQPHHISSLLHRLGSDDDLKFLVVKIISHQKLLRFVHQFFFFVECAAILFFAEGLCTSWVLRSMKKNLFYSEIYNWKMIFTVFSCSCWQSNTVKWKYFTSNHTHKRQNTLPNRLLTRRLDRHAPPQLSHLLAISVRGSIYFTNTFSTRLIRESSRN